MKKVLLLIIAILATVVSVNAATITVYWDAPTTNNDGTPITFFEIPSLPGKANYKLYWGTTVGGPYPSSQAIVGNSTGTTEFVVIGLTEGTKYCFVVSAIKGATNEGAKTSEACEIAAVAPGAPLRLRFVK